MRIDFLEETVSSMRKSQLSITIRDYPFFLDGTIFQLFNRKFYVDFHDFFHLFPEKYNSVVNVEE